MDSSELEDKVKNARIVLSEFMTAETIGKLEKNAYDELQLAMELYPDKPKEFYQELFQHAELDRYLRGRVQSVGMLNQTKYFFGWNDKRKRFVNTCERKKGFYIDMPVLTPEQIKNRLKYIYGEP